MDHTEPSEEPGSVLTLPLSSTATVDPGTHKRSPGGIELRMELWSKDRDIAKGEEIFVTYGTQYWFGS